MIPSNKTCLYHPDQPGVAFCKRCNGYICKKCIIIINGNRKCKKCYEDLIVSKRVNNLFTDKINKYQKRYKISIAVNVILFLIIAFQYFNNSKYNILNTTQTHDERKSNSSSRQTNMISSNRFSIDNIIKLSSGFYPVYEIVKEEDLSNISSNIKQARIIVPLGLKKSDLEDNFKHAIYKLYNKYHADGISIYAYKKGDNINDFWTVGKAEFTPEGNWDKIRPNVNLSEYEVRFWINDGYFNPESVIQIGSVVTLYKSIGSSVPISNSAESWEEWDTLVKVPNNTKAKIIDIYRTGMPVIGDFIRYKISVKYNNKSYNGWVHSTDIKENQ